MPRLTDAQGSAGRTRKKPKPSLEQISRRGLNRQQVGFLFEMDRGVQRKLGPYRQRKAQRSSTPTSSPEDATSRFLREGRKRRTQKTRY